ncbi:MAG TPA: PKD domain-containing protein [Ferruginibacter sp.]|nr:PKD domain-containing protein [Ferruginibacter sp.]HMP19400.1 PKD domain-containing protein [Ferruginibacter sp.]
MKRIIIFLLLLTGAENLQARHLKGGFVTYTYLGPGTQNPNNLRYRLTYTVYMDCTSQSMQIDDLISLTFFDGASLETLGTDQVWLSSSRLLSKTTDDPCISGNQAICFYRVVDYEKVYELAPRPGGYIISYQRCCRIDNMDNLFGSGSVGNTYAIQIPGTASPVPNADKNSSPRFLVNDTVVVCSGSYFSYQVQASDPDGDELTYSLCSAYAGGAMGVPAPVISASPPFAAVPYTIGYSGTSPMGNQVTIDSKTGLLSGIAPPILMTGEYVVTVCVNEYRNGILLGQSRKELHIKVRDCVPIVARLAPKAVVCDSYNVSFSNDVPNPTGTLFEWTFGDSASGANNISNLPTPTHTYSDTGVFTAKLKVTIGGLCADSAILLVRVYPGFLPDLEPVAPYCKGVPVSFVDKSTTSYGQINSWRWDFGNTGTIEDTSILRNPAYTYDNAGTYKVRLNVTSSFGCTGFIEKDIVIPEKPPLAVFPKDTTYCALDTLQLRAEGAGNFTWSPAVNMQGANTATPLVFRTVPSTLYVTLNANGCTNTDSVKLNPVNNLTNSITASSTSICEGDTITLTGSSNYTSGVSWQWSPAVSTSFASNQSTRAFPVADITYSLTTTWGKHCKRTATVPIVVKKLLVPQAGPDVAICIGQQTAQLNVTGSDSYRWEPAAGLSSTTIANPVAAPVVTTKYFVYGSTIGCSATKADSLVVTVRSLPALGLTNDTLICSIDTLRLNATGTGNFAWSPNYMISSITASSPLVSPDVPTSYFVSLTDAFGCISRDTVLVDVKLFVTINAGTDTTICRTDTFTLKTNSDALSYKWEPATYLSSDIIKHPVARPLDAAVTYKVTGNIGKCEASDFITVTTVPYPAAHAGNDTLVCFEQPVQLQASGGSIYSWAPPDFLSNTQIANPQVIQPTTDTRYIVTVTDNLGCPRPVNDTVWVRVYPKVNVKTINDTSVVLGQPLQLNVSGGLNNDFYQWTPSLWLSNAAIRNPVALPENDTRYIVKLTTRTGNCEGYDTLNIKVFKLPPGFYVPTAFSPNGDGLNDVMKPVALGIRQLNYFRVFNRLGQMVYTTTEIGKGWDGTFKGRLQDPASFVWMAQGVTYRGEVITKKGSVVLLR